MIEIDDYDTPWEVACKLINATRVTHSPFPQLDGKEVQTFDMLELRLIGEHLIKYAETEMEGQHECE